MLIPVEANALLPDQVPCIHNWKGIWYLQVMKYIIPHLFYIKNVSEETASKVQHKNCQSQKFYFSHQLQWTTRVMDLFAKETTAHISCSSPSLQSQYQFWTVLKPSVIEPWCIGTKSRAIVFFPRIMYYMLQYKYRSLRLIADGTLNMWCYPRQMAPEKIPLIVHLWHRFRDYVVVRSFGTPRKNMNSRYQILSNQLMFPNVVPISC